jgi:hypothetical protein
MESGTGILPVRLCGIGILPMIHGLEAHATKNRFRAPSKSRRGHERRYLCLAKPARPR